jgi:hypothetical protein
LCYLGERKNKWVACSNDPRRGRGVFVKGQVTKDEILALYKGVLNTFKKHIIQPKTNSSYILDFEEKGLMYRIDGENSENVFGSVGHIINTIVGLEESKYNVYFEYSPHHEAFLVKANYSWNSGNNCLFIYIYYLI